MAWLLSLLLFATVVLAVLLLYGFIFQGKLQMADRLSQIARMGDVGGEDEYQRSFYERILRPFYQKIADALGNLAPREIKESMKKKIVFAGNPYNFTFNNIVLLMLSLGVAFPVLVLALGRLAGLEPQKTIVLMIAAALFGFYLPVLMLNSRIARRQKEIQKNMPDMLDLLLVSVEAGLGFDSALKKVAEKMPGELSKEISRTLEEVRMGKTRTEALRALAERAGVDDCRTFVSAVIQAEQLGASISKTLHIQAATMREKRRQRAEEMAMKAPLKMLFPLIFFIFPALFVVLLGPAAIRILEMFSKM